MFKYMDYPLIPDIIFVVFMISWLVTRQILFFFVVLSTTSEVYSSGRFKWDPPNGYYLSENVLSTFRGALWLLLLLMCIWFATICRLAVSVVRGNPVEDVRSDDEDDE